MAFRNEITKGTLQLVVLGLLKERPMYGYEIVKTVNERTSGTLLWREAALYPALRRMERRGLVSGRWVSGPLGKRRRYYSLTKKGTGMCAEWRADWESFSRAVNMLVAGASS